MAIEDIFSIQGRGTGKLAYMPPPLSFLSPVPPAVSLHFSFPSVSACPPSPRISPACPPEKHVYGLLVCPSVARFGGFARLPSDLSI
eukprot:CAMPEP_0119130972 /NCGR_PEP_ID=MMETSP1310-20130426/9117_1 /TAXON_ID=464262 /ORGANISM="Genus nov. species nov., Strain RCC2339" /LENGTH=86 /DNA_ID=CAMNT_0007121519 /DNA_START=1 /DNA_END=258 /DNA_ORIENTATION=+